MPQTGLEGMLRAPESPLTYPTGIWSARLGGRFLFQGT